MIEIFSLDDIEIKPHILDRWNATIITNVAQLLRRNPQLNPSDIPDEQFRVIEGAFGEIFVKIGGLELRLRVPRSDWRVARK